VESFSDVEVNLRGEAVKLMAGGNFANGDSNGNGVAVVEKEEKGSAAAVAVAPPAAAPTPLTTVTSGLWTEAQELALVQALKTVPKDASDRWDQVAAAVEGRSKVECMKRFKELKASFKAKKG
jgi:DnaJ family protein C protein 2